jgi:hypothetical protein
MSSNQNPRAVGVAFLARCADGIATFRRFADSYRLHQAGYDHELIVIYKGFEQQSHLVQARAVFQDLAPHGIELDDTGFDIGAYLQVSRRVPHQYLCFLNAHSELAAPGWLAPLAAHVARDNVGIAGATGSYESILDSVLLMLRVIWMSHDAGPEDAAQLAYYFDFLLRQRRPDWYGDGPRRYDTTTSLTKWVTTALKQLVRRPLYRMKGTSLIWPGAQRLDIRQFPKFPNPHIRSNGFIIRRDRMLSFAPSSMRSKVDASLFESGKASLTAKLRRAGLNAVIVGRDGQAFDVAEWSRSNTFRLGEQANLLVTDNHTRAFANMSEGARVAHARMTWGQYLGDPPKDFPALGFEFRKGSSDPS